MKAKGFFVELNDFSLLVARTSSATAPFTLEEVIECPLSSPQEDIELAVQAIGNLQSGQFVQAVCGVSPPDRMLRRATLENPAKARDPSFLPNYLTNQFKVDLASTAVQVLNANGGSSFEPGRQLTKEIVFCGAPRDSLIDQQDRLVELYVFPNRLELTSVATVGGVANHMATRGDPMPTLVLEIGPTSSLVLIVNGDQLDVARPIPYGFNSMYPIVRQELGLKDEESAKKLFTSATFDFTEMGNMLLKKLLKELQASTGFYEVQTGQTIGHLHVSALPDNFRWISASLSRSLGVEIFEPHYGEWLDKQGISIGPEVDVDKLKNGWFGLFCLMGRYERQS
ncbi:MAG: hypothetical protein ACFB21_08010 [Opitutales bacterium]